MKGININKEEFKISQLADDTTLYLADISSLKNSLLLLERFSVCSGLCINKDKTEVIPLNIQNVDKHKLGISWQKGSFKMLGIWFSSNEDEMIRLNLNDKVERIKNTIIAWSNMHLTMFGKITVLKTMVLSQILNVCSTVYVPEYFIKQVDKLFFQFLWGQGKRAKVKREVMINSKTQGGAKMIDFQNMIYSMKALWIKRFLSSTSKSTNLALHCAGIKEKSILLHKLPAANFPLSLSKFDSQIIDSWYKFYAVYPDGIQEILNEKLVYNKFILIGGKTISPNHVFIKKTNISQVGQLVKHGNFKSIQEIEIEFNCDLEDLRYHSVLSAIPMGWKTKIKSNTTLDFTPSSWEIPRLKLNVEKLNNKDIYNGLACNMSTPQAQNKWVEYYPFMDKFNWSKIYLLPAKVSNDLKLQSLQFSIIHRYTACNYNLNLWNIIKSPMCQSCNLTDSIEHFFFYCDCVHSLWNVVKILSKKVLNLHFNCTVLEVLLGIPCQRNSALHLLNLIMLLTKQFIYLSKKNDNPLSEYIFCKVLYSSLETELYLCKLKGKNHEFIRLIENMLEFIENRYL